MNFWVAKSTLFPFAATVINKQSVCLAILPIKKSLYKADCKYIEIKNLQQKMLLVLDLLKEQLTTVTFYYNENNKEQFSLEQKNSLTKKILTYCEQTKLVLQFGSLNFLDLDYLNLKKIVISTVLHPEDLLQNQGNKRQAYQDLLLCKTKLSIL
jgi:hypothetical protein